MLISFRSLLSLITLLLALCVSGCSHGPVRHLASNACMIQAEQTTRQEVLALMGEPDAKRKLDSSTEEWVYYEEDKSSMQAVPLVGDMFDSKGYHKVVVTLSGDTVMTCRYTGFENDEFDWKKDYSWQEIK